MRKPLAVPIALALAQVLPFAGARAQSPDPEPVSLDDMVVSARKREEPLQDVPVSIAVFTGRQLDARGVTSLRDLGPYVPGLQFTDLAGYNLVYLRGVGTDAFIPAADPSVATYLDGIYFPSAHSLVQAFGSLERVEVLKGPQGTLFGRNSTGGALTLWTESPQPAAFAALQASRESFDGERLRLHGNLPLGSQLAGSVSAFQYRADNYYRLENPAGESLPEEISRGGRLRLAWRPSEELELILTGLSARQSGTSTTTSANTDPSPLLGGAIAPETREYVVTADTRPSLVTDTRAAYGQFGWRLAPFDVLLRGSTYEVDAHDYVYDFDASSQPFATYGAVSDFQRIRTAELQLTSNATSWGAERWDWVAGGYWLRSLGGYDPGYLRLGGTPGLPLDALVAQIPGAAEAAAGAPLPDSLTFVFTGLIAAESLSGYAQSTVHLNDLLALTAGGRWQVETRRLVRSDVALGDPQGEREVINSYAARESTVRNFSPKLSLDLRPADGVLLYGSFQEAFKSATYNIINIYQEPDYVAPEQVTSWELGLKSDWLERSLRVNLAAFRTTIRDLQTGFVSFTSGGAINFENAGRARIRGYEATLAWVPLPTLNPGLELSASGSWLDSRYLEYLQGSGYDEQTGLAFGRDNGTGRDFSGNRVVRTPEFTGVVGFSQKLPFAGNRIEAAADWAYNSGFYYLAQNSPGSFEKAHDVLNARLTWRREPWSLGVTVFGANLLDARYNLAQFHTDFGRQDTLAPPRTFGARVDWTF